MWRFHSHRGAPTRPTVKNAASQALYGVIQPSFSSVSGILNVGRTQAPISPPSRAHRRGCPMLCFHSDRGVQTSLSVDTVASQALCGTIQSRPSSGSGIFSVGRAHGRLYRPREPHRRGSPMWSFHSHRGVPTRPTVDTAALHTLCGPTRAVASSGSGILSVGRAHGRLHRPQEPLDGGTPCGGFTATEAFQRAPPS